MSNSSLLVTYRKIKNEDDEISMKSLAKMRLSSLKHSLLLASTPWILGNVTCTIIFKLKMTSKYLRIL